MKKILLYYNFSFSMGGGEHLPLSFIEALQHKCDLTVALDAPEGLRRAVEFYGADVDFSAVKVARVTPEGYDVKKHTLLSSLRRSRMLKKLARGADVCISLTNITDFGKPAHHFINMLAFGDRDFAAYAAAAAEGLRPGKAPLSARLRDLMVERVLRPVLGMRRKRDMIRDPSERIYPNSRFTERMMAEFYGRFNSSVFYPPTMFEPAAETGARDPLKTVYIGRIVAEKRIERIIGIVERAREISGLDLTLEMAGRTSQQPEYGKKLERIAAEKKWLSFPGALYGAEKAAFLASGTFAIHAERLEAFGISIAEYLAAGLVPVVPDEGGSCEIVSDPELSYGRDEEAARILARLATDAEFRESRRRKCAERAKMFSKDAYLARQKELLGKIAGE